MFFIKWVWKEVFILFEFFAIKSFTTVHEKPLTFQKVTN